MGSEGLFISGGEGYFNGAFQLLSKFHTTVFAYIISGVENGEYIPEAKQFWF